MPPTVKICVNGFVLSTMLFDGENNNGDQEGFLYGTITKNVKREISDQSMSNTQEEILISICSSVPFGNVMTFYTSNGEIKTEEIDYNLGERQKGIVGWYRYRRYTTLFPSSREVLVHSNLKNYFANRFALNDSYFVYAVLTSSNLPNFATHSYDYAFFLQKDETFKSLHTTILNLGDTRNSYRTGSIACAFMNSSSFRSVLSNAWSFDSFYETEDQIQEFHQRLRLKLDSLQEELAASDAVNATLEEDIKHLSDEMQVLLATQEQLSSSSAGSQSTATISESNIPKVAESSHLKRTAVPLESSGSAKRVCEHQYFDDVSPDERGSYDSSKDESEELQPQETSSDLQLVLSSVENVSSPDIRNIEEQNVELEMKDINSVQSPSSTVEVVISVEKLNNTYFEPGESECDVRSYSSPELSDVKESGSESAVSPKEVDSFNLGTELKASNKSELQNKTITSALVDADECNSSESALETSAEAKASSSSDDMPKKMNPPFIIYASKSSAPSSISSPSSSTEVKTESDTIVEDNTSNYYEDISRDSGDSPTPSTNYQSHEEEN